MAERRFTRKQVLLARELRSIGYRYTRIMDEMLLNHSCRRTLENAIHGVTYADVNDFDEHDKYLIWALYREGISPKEIGKKFDVHENIIMHVLDEKIGVKSHVVINNTSSYKTAQKSNG